MLWRCPGFIVVVALAVALLGCASPGTFYTEVKGETTVDGDPSPLGSILGVFPGIGSFTNMDFNANQDFRTQGISTADVQSVKVTVLTVKITDPSTQGFEFLDDIAFYAKVGSDEALVADATGIASSGLTAPNPTLELTVHDTELVQYLQAPQMSLVVRGHGRSPPQNTTLEATAKFRITVKLVDL